VGPSPKKLCSEFFDALDQIWRSIPTPTIPIVFVQVIAHLVGLRGPHRVNLRSSSPHCSKAYTAPFSRYCSSTGCAILRFFSQAPGGRVYNETRVDHVWSDDDELAFLKSAPPHLHLPLLLAVWTGQRQGDLLRLTWSAYTGKEIRLRQSKSVRRGHRPVNVVIPVAAPLKSILDATPTAQPHHSIEYGWQALDLIRIPRKLGQGLHQGRHRGFNLQ
jgi:hypothetical protein